MTGMSPKDAIELKEVPYYNPAKNTMTSAREPWIEYGLIKKTYRLSDVVLSPSRVTHGKGPEC